MALAVTIIEPILRLGLITLLLNLFAPARPVMPSPRPLNVSVGTTGGDAQSPGRQFLMVDGKPFMPVGVTYHFTLHRDSWDEDLEEMRSLGLNTVRIDLGWNDVEPILPGHYRFGLLDEFLDRAYRHGIYVVPVFSHTTQALNTPFWFWALHRDWRVVDEAGNSPLEDLPSVNNPAYRQQLRDYMVATVRHIENNPVVLAYQLLNEPRYNSQRLYDYNDYSIAAFRQWLAGRYGSVARLNDAWDARYGSFGEVTPPQEVDAGKLPQGPQLKRWSDWREFSYENLADFVGDLATAVKATDPHHPVIVAEMAWWWWGEQPYTGVSPLHIYKDADIVGYDLYPDSVNDASYFLFTSDMLSRYWKKPVWVMELNRKDGAPSGDEIHQFVSAALDGGASGIFYFQWNDDWQDGGRYGVLDDNGKRKQQFGGLASTIRWLKGTGEKMAMAPPPKPDLYLAWPSTEVGEVPGNASPAWEIYKTARRIAEGGLRIGLVMEELIHAVDPQKLLILQGGQLQSGKGSSTLPVSTLPASTGRGYLISDQ